MMCFQGMKSGNGGQSEPQVFFLVHFSSRFRPKRPFRAKWREITFYYLFSRISEKLYMNGKVCVRCRKKYPLRESFSFE